MRIGRLQGAAMTAVGIGRIDPAVLSVPDDVGGQPGRARRLDLSRFSGGAAQATDVMVALQSGMIDACCVSPIAAAVYQ